MKLASILVLVLLSVAATLLPAQTIMYQGIFPRAPALWILASSE